MQYCPHYVLYRSRYLTIFWITTFLINGYAASGEVLLLGDMLKFYLDEYLYLSGKGEELMIKSPSFLFCCSLNIWLK